MTTLGLYSSLPLAQAFALPAIGLPVQAALPDLPLVDAAGNSDAFAPAMPIPAWMDFEPRVSARRFGNVSMMLAASPIPGSPEGAADHNSSIGYGIFSGVILFIALLAMIHCIMSSITPEEYARFLGQGRSDEKSGDEPQKVPQQK